LNDQPPAKPNPLEALRALVAKPNPAREPPPQPSPTVLGLTLFGLPPAEPSQATAPVPDFKTFKRHARELKRLKEALAAPLPAVRFDPAPGPLSLEFQEARKNLGPGDDTAKRFAEAARISRSRRAETVGSPLLELWAMGLRLRRGRGQPKKCEADCDMLWRLKAENPDLDDETLLRMELHAKARKMAIDSAGKKGLTDRAIERRIQNALAEKKRREQKICVKKNMRQEFARNT
jgi:hypothetical protein